MSPKILLAEDDAACSELVCSGLGDQYEIVLVENVAAVFEQFKKRKVPDVVLLNYVLPNATGKSPEKVGLILLRFIKQVSPKTAVIMFTGWDSVDVAFEAGSLGASAYFLKSPENFENDFEKLKQIVKNALDNKNYQQQNVKLLSRISENEPLTFIEQVERDAIVQTLKETGANIVETAKRLGIGRQTLYNKIKAYGIET
jgi:DNA-binding NtrC family response regulator